MHRIISRQFNWNHHHTALSHCHWQHRLSKCYTRFSLPPTWSYVCNASFHTSVEGTAKLGIIAQWPISLKTNDATSKSSAICTITNTPGTLNVGIPSVSSKYSNEIELIKHLSEFGDVNEAWKYFCQMQTEALSHGEKDLLPGIDSCEVVMNALLEKQKQLMVILESNDSELQSMMFNQTISSEREQTIGQIFSIAEKAEQLVVQMEDISGVSDRYSSMRLSEAEENELRQPSLEPTSYFYDSVIFAYVNTITAAEKAKHTSHFTKNALYIAKRWLQRMETLSVDSSSSVTPTVETYHRVMEACAAGNSSMSTAIISSNRLCKAPILTQTVFDKLNQSKTLRPSHREYRLLLRTWCASTNKDAAYLATGLWRDMCKAFKEGEEEMAPTLEDGKMVLEAWSRAVNKHAARRAQNVLTAMENLHKSKNSDEKLDLECYKYVLTAMSRSKVAEVGHNVPKLFKTMEEKQIFPDTACFDAAIETLKNCTKFSIANENVRTFSKMAEEMLLKMEKEQDRSSTWDIRPSAKTYTNVIEALSMRKTKSCAEKADAILKRMESKYADGDTSMMPKKDAYLATINAYGASDMEGSFIHANEVLQRMITQYTQSYNDSFRPDSNVYHAVVLACAKSSENQCSTPESNRQALVLAISTVQSIKRFGSLHPSAQSYLLLLQCGIHLLPPGSDREKALCSIFRSCVRDGLVCGELLQEFQSVVSAEVYHREVMSDATYFGDVKIIPERWTRNLGYKVRIQDIDKFGGSGKRSPVISVMGMMVSSNAYNDYRMRRRWSKKGQKSLQGGRM